jgi:nicotinamide-nucleotide amidase
MTFPDALLTKAEVLLARARRSGVTICTAESCTGGLLSGCLTEIAGSSDVFDRAFITYSNTAKTEMLGVPTELIAREGAVSEKVARAMAEGALRKANASLAAAVTGIAGPGGGSPGKPVGTVHFAVARANLVRHVHHAFGDQGRNAIRIASVQTALDLLSEMID